MIKIIIAGVAGVLAAGPAFAQDLEPGKGFNGIYVGAAGGYDVQSNDNGRILFDRNLDGRYNDTVLTGTGANAFSPGFCGGRGTSANAPGRQSAANLAIPVGSGCRNDRDAGAYYGRIGLDQQYGQIVIGVVGEFGKTDINDSTTGFSVTPANYAFYREVSWEAGVRARAGYTPNDTTLFYGAFGPSYAKINSEFSSSQSTNTFTARGRETQFGFQAGGGIEQRIGSRFSIGLEYLYHQYQDDDYRVRVAGPAGTPFTNGANGGTINGTDMLRSDSRFNWHSLRATAGFRF